MDISITINTFANRFGIEEGCRMVKEAGFEAVDWGLAVWNSGLLRANNGFPPENIFDKEMDEIIAHYQPMIDALKKYGLRIGQAHAPFNPYHHNNPDLLDYAIEVFKKNIWLCDKVGCKYVVIHGVKPFYFESGNDLPGLEEADRLNQKLFESLIPTLQQTDVVVCMENLFTGSHNYFAGSHCADANDAVAFIDSLNEKAGKECFGLCFDVGHLFLARVEMRYYISKLGKRIKTLHIQDTCGTEDSHLMPYTGLIPWAQVLDALKEAGYQGNINFEDGSSYNKKFLPEELIPEFLRHNVEIGKYFRKVIRG